MRTLRLLSAIAAAFALALALACARPARAQSYSCVMPVPKGLSIGSIAQLTKNAGDAINKKTGLDIDVQEYPYTYLDEPMFTLLDKLNKDKIDFLMVFPVDYMRYKIANPKDKSIPLFTVNMFGRPTHDVCFYTRASDNMSKASDLKGKTWGGVRLRYVQYLLHEFNIDTNPNAFFGKLEFVREENIADMLDLLLKGGVDVITMPTYQVNMVMNADKKYKAVKSFGCKEYEHNWIFVYRKGVPKEHAEALKNAFLGAHKDREFMQFKFLLTAIKGRFEAVDIKNLKNSIKIAKLMNKYKWRAIESDYIKKHPDKAQ
jgi:ABC-type phosphate/phosphonate transport system substrate-binding protein